MTLNPADPRPLYQQLAAHLREQIQSGELTPGRLIHNPSDDHAARVLSCEDVTGFRGCE